MRPAASYPSYYCPPGIEIPKHCGWIGKVGPSKILAQSPDGQEGMYWGGLPYEPALKEYFKKTRDGWWVLMLDHLPQSLTRMRTTTGPAIEGAQSGHVWMVPQLLQWHPDAMLVSAIPEVMRDYQWQPPEHLVPIMERLRHVCMFGMKDNIPYVEDQDVIDLAIQILALNYHVSIHELSAGGWLNTEMVGRIIECAGGVRQLVEELEARKGSANAS